MNIAEKVGEALFEIGAVKVKIDPPFTWVSGIKSPVYCDNRKLISYPKHRDLIVEAFASLIKEKNLQLDAIAGTATAAIPWAAFLAYKLGLPMVYIRPEKKAHGMGKQIEGELKPGSRVLLLEDLISTGGSSLKAVEALKEEGKAVVSDVFAIVSWELKESAESFAAANINLTTLTNFTGIIGLAASKGLIPNDKLAVILEFKKDPPAWGAKMVI